MWLHTLKPSILILFILIFVSTPHGYAQAATVRFVDADGETLDEVEYMLHQEKLYLPVDTLKSVFDSEMTDLFHRPKKQLVIKTKGKEVQLGMGKVLVSIDSGKQTHTLTAPPLVLQGQPMLPVAFFTEILPHLDDVEVMYNPNLHRIRIIPKTFWDNDNVEDIQEWTVIIDPGHGGVDLGCKSQNGLIEKDIVLAVAKQLQDLAKQSGINIQLTRDQDIKKSRVQRVQVTNKNQGQLFLSLHCNASYSPNHKGMRIYLNNPNGKLRFSAASMPVFGKKSLNIRTQSNFLNQSKEFASFLEKELNFVLDEPIVISEFPIITLKEIYMPAVLLELGYLSNVDDANRLSKSEYLSEIAEAIVRAVQLYSTSIKQIDKPKETLNAD